MWYSTQDYVTLFLIWVISTIITKSILNKFKLNPKPNLPPSPFPLPILGHLHLLSPLPHQSLHNLATKHGPLIFLKLGSIPCIVASTPETAKSILKTHETSFLDRPIISAVDYLTYGSADFSFAPYGAYWKFMKKICMTELLGGRMLGQLEPVRSEEVRRLVEVIEGRVRVGREVDVGGELMRMTNNVVSRSLLGRRCERAEEVRRLVSEVAEITGRFNLADYVWFLKDWDLQGFGKRLREIRERFDELVEGVMEEKRRMRGGSGEGGKDMLDLLLGLMEDEKAEMRLTKDNIKAFIMDIFAAGTDTSAITTEWALSELINNPQILQKARQEIHTVIGSTRLIHEFDIPNFPYLKAIVKETLRLHPTRPMIV